MMRRILFSILLAVAATPVGETRGQSSGDAPQPSRWEAAISKFEARDAQEAPPTEGVLFIGSSSIRMWDLDKWFPDAPVINRGFGGSEIADSIEFADRIIFPHAPRVVVLYAGDNDIAKGKTPEVVVADYRRFVETVRKKLPKARIVFIAIKPSLSRWKLIEKIRQANGEIQKLTEQDPLAEFVDVDTPMLGEDGRPRKELFKDDGLHLNEEGYRLWTKLVKERLE
jgi:lysophospholipase L1-like esterase